MTEATHQAVTMRTHAICQLMPVCVDHIFPIRDGGALSHPQHSTQMATKVRFLGEGRWDYTPIKKHLPQAC